MAVHSAKDLTTDDPPDLALAAVLPRADPRDAWCGPHGSLAEVPAGARVGTASTRRTAQLGAVRPDLHVEGLRGNVDTRLRKRRERGLAGIVLAACGLDRLGLADEIGFRVPTGDHAARGRPGVHRAADARRRVGAGRPRERRGRPAHPARRARRRGDVRRWLPRAGRGARRAARAGGLRLRVWIGRPDGSESASASGEGDDPEALGRAVADEALRGRAAARSSRLRARDRLPRRRGPGRSGPDHRARPRACSAAPRCSCTTASSASELLDEAPAGCLLIDASKRPDHHTMTQDEIDACLVEHGRAGRLVVRLKGGDPFVFGRGGEEALALSAAGVPFEVVPGITSAIAAPAYAGIPVTHRGVAAQMAIVTGHERPGQGDLRASTGTCSPASPARSSS